MANSGHQLHTLLEAVAAAPAKLARAWSNVLDAEYGTTEFARRHSEVTALLADFLGLIEADPRDQRRLRNLRYSPAWWNAVVGPEIAWGGTTHTAQNLIRQEDLDALASAADVMDGGLEESEPTETDLTNLRTATVNLVDSVKNAALTPGLQAQLLHDLGHVLWCLDNRTLFGSASVQRAAERAAGAVIAAAPRVPETRRNSWNERVAAFTTSLMIFVGAIETTQLAITATKETYMMIQSALTADDEKVIVDEDVIDGEVVDEPPADRPEALP